MDQSSNDGYWSWADFSHREIVEGRARGNRRALWLRSRIQTFLFKLGNFAQNHSAPVVMIGLVLLVACALFLFKAKMETNVETLWMEVGGHLENELAYSKKFGSDYVSYEVIIQTPNTQGTNVLTTSALLEHVDFVRRAMQVKVKVFDQTWSIADICVKPNVPSFDLSAISKMLEKSLPCIVITPLDCFWDGGKIHPQNISYKYTTYQWTNFNPQHFLHHLSNRTQGVIKNDMPKMQSMLKKSGISHGYTNKPCLEPSEEGCPNTAPNKATMQRPDIGKMLKGGCRGFAGKLMHWPEDLIVGGVNKNKDGVITSAEALQTIINIMDEKNLHQYWYETDGFLKTKVHHILNWNVEKAKMVLNAWQRKFVEEINKISRESKKQKAMAFSTQTFNDLLQNFSTPNQSLIACGYLLMVVYACFTMVRWNSLIQSQGCMGILGVLLVTLSVAAGLGLCSALGISFNAATTQVLPFIALGLGVDDMFLLSHTYRDLNSRNLKSKEQAGHCLSTTGVSIMLTSLTNAIAFFMAAIIPIPALRTLCIKAGVIIVFNFFSIVIIFPAMIAMDVRRRHDMRYDIFCCVQKDSNSRVTQIRPDTISYDNTSMVTMNQTSDEGSSLHQISTASANVSVGPSSSADAFVLPGVALRASANCNINESICNGMLAGDIMGLPGIGNIVVSVSSEHKSDAESQNANARANITNSSKGKHMNISASSSATSAARGENREDSSRQCCRNHSPKDYYSGCQLGNTVMPGSTTRRDKGSFKKPPKDARAQSFVNMQSKNSNYDYRQNTPSFGSIQLSANADAASNRVPTQCSSNAEVILSPGHVCSSRERSGRWTSEERYDGARSCLNKFNLTYFVKTYYAPNLQKLHVKIMVLILSACVFSISIYGCTKVKDGMDMADVVPKGTSLADFLQARNKYFSFHDMSIVTKSGFEYSKFQDKLYRLHNEFKNVRTIVKTDDNGLPKFWLMFFRDWLNGLQRTFDKEWKMGRITYDGVTSNASSDGKIAHKLLLHTVNANNRNKNQMVRSATLVDDKGVIHIRGFYYFLRAWKNHDPMGYELSQANIKPDIEPWQDDEDEKTVSSPAKEIEYAQMPFYLSGLKDTEDYVETIKHIRKICKRYNDEGLFNYPRGVPFTFWEQYLWLRKHLLITVSIVLAASFLVISAMLVNLWAGSIVVTVLAITTVELYGFLGLAGIKLSAIPVVTLIFSIGVGVEFTVHLCMVFVTTVGNRNERLQYSLEKVLSPVVHGAISTLLGIVMLAGSEFDFIVKYFFHLLAALILIGFLNGIVLLPVILSLVGPNPEVVPIRELSTAASTRSWLAMVPFDRNIGSSVSNLTSESHPTRNQEGGTETDDVNLQIIPVTEKCQHDPKVKRWKRSVVPKHYTRTNHIASETPPKGASPNQSEQKQSNSATKSVAKVTATATVTLELQSKEGKVIRSLAPRSSIDTDLELEDCEEEFV